MFDKLMKNERRYEELTTSMADPEAVHDQKRFRELMQEHAALSPMVDAYRAYKDLERQIGESRELFEGAADKEMKDLARDEQRKLEQKREDLVGQLKGLLVPKDPLDQKNIIVEIRAGTGGDEAALFAADLFRMYSYYTEGRGWKVEIMSSSPTGIGGFKEVIFSVTGRSVYAAMRYESGVHRVQRVPVTEAGGRIHTSTVTVAVLPEVEETEITINPVDLRIDVMRSGGPGGQSVNTTDSAVRITHLPTGLVVHCQDEKSQLKNKNKALRILRARLYEQEEERKHAERAQERKSQVGTGERSEKIRTYNFPQNRFTDHRINLTLYRLEAVMKGDLGEVIEAMRNSTQEMLLKSEGV